MISFRSSTARLMSAVASAGIALACASCSADPTVPDEQPGGERPAVSTTPSRPAAPAVANKLFVLKAEQPFILLDVAPNLATLQSLGAEAQEEYLLRTAVRTLVAEALGRKEYQGKERFTVRVIAVTEKDEYKRPKWSTALELAVLETDRATLGELQAADVDLLMPDAITLRFTRRQLTLDNLAKAGQK